jgi:hypothetical protein
MTVERLDRAKYDVDLGCEHWDGVVLLQEVFRVLVALTGVEKVDIAAKP